MAFHLTQRKSLNPFQSLQGSLWSGPLAISEIIFDQSLPHSKNTGATLVLSCSNTSSTLWPKGLDIYCFLPGIHTSSIPYSYACLPHFYIATPILLYSNPYFPGLSYFLLFNSIFLWSSTFSLTHVLLV